LKDVAIRDVSLTSALKPGDKVTGTGIAGLRLVRGARVESLQVSGLTIEGYETGVLIDEGTAVDDLRFERVVMRNVAKPWATAGVDVADGSASLTLRLKDRS
jgi:hypothetical protein